MSANAARLVILGSSLTGLAVARDAHALGLRAAVIDTDFGIGLRSRCAEPMLMPARTSQEDILQRVLSAATPRDYLIATSDFWLRFSVANRAVLDQAFRKVLIPSNATIETCLDKAKFGKWCREQQLSAPCTWSVDEEPRPTELKPPMLIRPAKTLHGAAAARLPKAVEVHTETELSEWLARFAAEKCAALVSESLLGQSLIQFSAPFARTPEALSLFTAKKVRPAPKHCSVGSYVELVANRDVEELARRAVVALDYYGVGEAEILYSETTGRLYLIEINARPWMQYALAPASGHDFLGLLIGQPRAMRPVRQGHRWIDFESDLYNAMSGSVGEVRLGETSLFGYLRSLALANVYARFSWRDPVPALHSRLPTGR
ncbi:MAG TPA: hypothetical protein VK629_18735 [Steroidobacteraceae bacterium]|nr:hypothetical protein [Steroidobacteraceae bacterium]